ncbi:MAG: hypothetical protein DSY43_01910 [Gammaproteobacteria bacterium]|nr:MAG: hypothetical protein DSY43_01910 [Gammaproteobacteria bacterium]
MNNDQVIIKQLIYCCVLVVIMDIFAFICVFGVEINNYFHVITEKRHSSAQTHTKKALFGLLIYIVVLHFAVSLYIIHHLVRSFHSFCSRYGVFLQRLLQANCDCLEKLIQNE